MDEDHEPGLVLDGDNLFADLGLEGADDLLMRSQLLRRIQATIRARGLSQAAAGRLVGMAAPEVSHLMKGRISRFSIERLVKALRALEPGTRVHVAFTTEEPAIPEAR